MAVGTTTWPTMYPVKGVSLGTACAGIKKADRRDLLVIAIDEGASVAGVFTQNAFCAAPVILSRRHLSTGDVRYLLVNSGNANACTGDKGLEDAMTSCSALAKLGGVEARQVLPFSTGVIGEFLPVDKLVAALPQALENARIEAWDLAAQTIMTTDTRPKGASVQFEYDGEVVTVTGIAKGAGMIKPNMATMLAYIATDAVVAQPLLDEMVKRAADKSFNRICVDGDTSTNDACVLIASGQTGLPMLTEARGQLYQRLFDAVVSVHQQLAQAIIRDAEGATKFVTLRVQGGKTPAECTQVAYAVAQSPLVKTALYASDPNWGRIIAAVGYAGVTRLDPSQVNIWLDDIQIVEQGCRAGSYREADGQAVVDKAEFEVRINLGRGKHEEVIWTSDLSHDYVTINAEYRS